MFARFFIDRPIFACVISVVIVILGALAYTQLPLALYPNVSPPSVFVRASYPGADPQTIANTVAIPLEEQINGVEDMLYMTTSCQNGAVSINVTFKVGTDLNMAQVLVQNLVGIATPKLPEATRSLGDVRIELGSSGLVASGFKEIQRRAALIAERGAQRVFPLAAWTAHHDLSAGHGDKRAGRTVDELQVANDETVIERYTAKSLKPLYGFIDEFDANFCNFHVVISLARYIKSFDRTTSLHPWDFSVSAALSASASDSYIPK